MPEPLPFVMSGLHPAGARGHFAAPPPGRRRGGFALIVTITLLALLVLALVSLAALTRVETRVAANGQQLAQARQHALLGLNAALGRLQELAGPDQRITATADIVNGRSDQKRHWTGVWNADASHPDHAHGEHLGWLVSGGVAAGEGAAAGAPAPGAEQQLIRLIGENTAGTGDATRLVDVLSEPIKASQVPGLSGTLTIGQFAYWVGDEGVKANATLVDPWKDETGDERRYSFINMQRSGLELVQATATDTLGSAYPANDPALARVLSLRQLPMLAASADPARLAEATRNRYHDLTAVSSSVLADVARGGLKKDLTNWFAHGAPSGAVEQDAAPIVTTGENTAPGMPAWGALRAYAAARATGALPASGQTALQPGHAPVATLFQIGFNISAVPGQPMKIHLFPTLVLWNPHSVPIAATTFQVAWRTFGARTLRFTPVASGTRSELSLGGSNSDYLVFDVRLDADLPPGQSLVFRVQDEGGDNPAYTGIGSVTLVNKADDGTSAVIEGNTYTAANLASGIRWSMSNTSGDTYWFVLREKTAVAPTGNGQTAGEYQAVRGVNYTGSTGTPVHTLAALADEPIAPRFAARLYARMAGHTGGVVGDRFRWIANQNYLARLTARADVDEDHNSVYQGLSSFFSDAENTSMGSLSFSDGDLRGSAGTFVYLSSPPANAVDMVLREVLPAGAVLTSLAQFQHANLSLVSQYPFYAVGNSLASPYIALGDTSVAVTSGIPGYGAFHDISHLLNRDLWDRYFLSTVPASLTNADLASSGYHLPNARHVVTPAATAALINSRAAFDTAAAHLSLRGGFNVNSASVQAWRALLSGHLGIETAGAARHPFSRFISPPGTVNNARNGHRVLTDAQIDILAEKIRDEVLARGPFLSLADFVNRRLVARGRDATDAQRLKGALQAAIDNADTAVPGSPVINDDALFQNASYVAGTAKTGLYRPQYQGGLGKVHPVASRLAFAPGYLTQADLLTAIGPALTARSDTFVIRAYGDVKNPATDAVEGKAWCEAVVQRNVEPVNRKSADPAHPDYHEPAAATPDFGRRFQIVSFRWLGPEDI